MLEEKLDIKKLIYEIRGKQVMLDSDLAKLYQCKNGTKEINQAVKNNLKKFPDRYAFRISECEWHTLKSKILTSKGGSRKGHTAFTEQGVAMLATILKSKTAIQVSISIMDAFVEMRKYISNNLLEQKYINSLVLEHDEDIKLLKETFDSFKEKTNHIFFKGQLYDAYSLLLDILNKAKEEIIIIDNYAGKELLDILKSINKQIIIVSKNIDETLKKKYESQYSNIAFNHNESFHDSFIIIDRKILHISGSSFKDLGKKCFYIGEITNAKYIYLILTSLLGGTIC